MKKLVRKIEHVGEILLAFILVVMIGLVMSITQGPTGNVVLEDLSVNENIGDEYGVLTAQNWIGLQGGTIRTQEGKTDYQQFLVFQDTGADDPLESCTVRFGRDEFGAVGDFLHCQKGDDIFEYQLIFTQGLEGEVEDRRIKDFENIRFMMLGQEFIITKAETNDNKIRLRLMGRPVQKVMIEGQKHTIVYDDEPYVVTIVTISDTTPPKVVLNVNGQTSSALVEKKAILIKNKFPVVINEILPNEGSEIGGEDQVVLVFGSRSVDIRDSDYTDDTFTRSEVRVNGVRIIDSKIRIKAVRSNDLITVSSITYRLQAAGPRGDVYIPAGQGLAENIRNPFALLSSAWDLRYGGVGDGVRYLPTRASGGGTIKFDAHGDGYDIEFTNNRGLFYDAPFLTKRGGTFAYGDDTEDLHFREGVDASDYLIEERDYFIVTKGSRGQGNTHILQFEGTANGKAVFTDLSGRSKILALFPTGAATSFFSSLFNFRNKIVVPILSITAYDVVDLEAGADDTCEGDLCEQIITEVEFTSFESKVTDHIEETKEESKEEPESAREQEPTLVAEPEPVVQEPVVKPESVLEPEPVVEPEPAGEPQVEPQVVRMVEPEEENILPPLSCTDQCNAGYDQGMEDCIASGTQDVVCHVLMSQEKQACLVDCGDRSIVAQPSKVIPDMPKAKSFDSDLSTNFEDLGWHEVRRVSKMRLGKRNQAQIEWQGEVDVIGLNLDNLVTIKHNWVEVKSDEAPQLNTPAMITLENIVMQQPVIYKNGKPCNTCTIVNYDRATKRLTFTTTSLSTFTAIDAAGLGRGTLVLSGSRYEFFVNSAGDAIVVDLDGDGDLDGSAVDIHTMGYAILDLGAAGDPTDVVLRTLSRYTANKTGDETTTIRFSLVNSRPAISLPTLRTYEAGAWEEGMTNYGARFSIEDKNRNNDLIIDYPLAGRRTAGVSIVMRD